MKIYVRVAGSLAMIGGSARDSGGQPETGSWGTLDSGSAVGSHTQGHRGVQGSRFEGGPSSRGLPCLRDFGLPW